MTILHLTEEQLKLVQHALDFYSRVGIGQMWAIKDHPTYQKVLADKLRPKKEIEVGDRTERGEVVEIGDGYIKTKGSWGNGEEIRTHKDVEDVKLSIDYGLYHEIRDEGEDLLNQGRNKLLQIDLHKNGNYGIFNDQVDESCRVAFDIIQVIRHEFWKRDPERSNITVDSSTTIWTKDGNKIKCQLDIMKDYNEQEFNRMCAEFLGWDQSEDGRYWKETATESSNWYLDELKFHSDWNWIMDVINKIDTIGQSGWMKNHAVIFVDGKPISLVSIEQFKRKKSTIKAIWEFLNWYNEQKQ